MRDLEKPFDIMSLLRAFCDYWLFMLGFLAASGSIVGLAAIMVFGGFFMVFEWGWWGFLGAIVIAAFYLPACGCGIGWLLDRWKFI